ncbi:hypothetical protein F993_02661 [Acinetobacter proteolyticus]|uniref:NERD domain-containing protein n=1 Tax=Acinetobacter proteolyticus TaxID=1776741 RepID=A0ABN0JC30_9GAMM|nr:hypothetical protein F993_02661 [Acinetobacter proteolyticus]
MLLYFMFFIIILSIITYLKSSYFKGRIGELMVKAHVEKGLGEEYMLFNNVTIA